MELALKWGGIKRIGGYQDNPKFVEMLEEYDVLNKSRQNNEHTDRQKEIMYEFVDAVDDPNGIYLDWDGIWVDKVGAKAYIQAYGREGKK